MINQLLSLTYTQVFGDREHDSIESYFTGITIEEALGLIELLNSNEANYSTTEKLITWLREVWFSTPNSDYFLKLQRKIITISREHRDAEIIIFNPFSSLTFFEYQLKHIQVSDLEKNIVLEDFQIERNLLEAYLLINQEKNRTNNGIEIVNVQFPRETLSWLSLSKPLQYTDLINRDLRELFVLETWKATLFFDFLKDDSRTRAILVAFLEKYECTWENYVKSISGMTVIPLRVGDDPGNNFVEISEDLPFFETCLRILDSIEIQLDNLVIKEDYLFLRNHPIYRIERNKFQVIYKRFFVEKIFRALYFELSLIGANENIMTQDSFRTQIYTSKFSENTLLYTILDRIFHKSCFTLYGKQVEDADPNFGAADYLAKDKGSVFLFESKDILIKKEVKDRLFIPEVREEFRKKFYKDEGADKGVLQLARSVKKFLDKEYERFGFCIHKFRFIYPILVVQSDSFNLLGINQILFEWFNEACEEVAIARNHRFKVKQVVIVDINTLIYLQEEINKKNTNLNSLIDVYLARTKVNQKTKHPPKSTKQYQDKYLVPFSHFIEYEIKRKNKIQAPRFVTNRLKLLFSVNNV